MLSPAEVSHLFPIQKNQIYLNHAGVSPLPSPAVEMLATYAHEVSEHGTDRFPQWMARIAKARVNASAILGAAVEEVAFTKSTSEGLRIVAHGIPWKAGDVVIAEEKPFPANWIPWRGATHFGAQLWAWPERNLRYDLAELEARLKQGGVRLVAVTSANYATGYAHDLWAVGKLCRAHGAMLMVDAIQTLGAMPFDARAMGIDFVAADSHKWLLGPEGSALFYCAKERLDLFGEHLVGWLGRQNCHHYDDLNLPPDPTARRFEEGAPNYGGIMSMGESLALVREVGVEAINAHNRALCAIMEGGLADAGWQVMSPTDASASHIVAVTKDGLDMNVVSRAIAEKARITAYVRRGFLRLAPHFYQNEAQMKTVVEVLRDFEVR